MLRWRFSPRVGDANPDRPQLPQRLHDPVSPAAVAREIPCAPAGSGRRSLRWRRADVTRADVAGGHAASGSGQRGRAERPVWGCCAGSSPRRCARDASPGPRRQPASSCAARSRLGGARRKHRQRRRAGGRAGGALAKISVPRCSRSLDCQRPPAGRDRAGFAPAPVFIPDLEEDLQIV